LALCIWSRRERS